MKVKNPLARKQRKMRTSGKDMCSCGLLNCDSMHSFCDTPYIRKLRKRKEAKVCIACGQKECKCKRKMEAGIIITKELKSKRRIREDEYWKRFQERKIKKA